MGRSHKRWYGTTQQLLVRLSRSRMERIVASETGIGIGDPLNFGVMQVLDLARVATLSNYLVTICRDLNDPQPCFDGHLGRLAERALVLLLLNAVPNNYKWAFAEQQPSAAAPYYVRRVESYIREHAREPITTDDLVTVGGVSARSIYHGFRRFRSTTPMGYLKAVRLDMARAALALGRRHGNDQRDRGRNRGRLQQSQPVLARLQDALSQIALADAGRGLSVSQGNRQQVGDVEGIADGDFLAEPERTLAIAR